MKSLFMSMLVVLALTGSAFAGHCGVQQVQVQRVVAHPHFVQQVQFVEVPHYVVQQQVQFVEPVRVVQKVQKVQVQNVQKVQRVQAQRTRSFSIQRSVTR